MEKIDYQYNREYKKMYIRSLKLTDPDVLEQSLANIAHMKLYEALPAIEDLLKRKGVDYEIYNLAVKVKFHLVQHQPLLE